VPFALRTAPLRSLPRNSAGASCTHQFLDTLTVQTTNLNSRAIPTTTSASSTTTQHPVIVIPRDAQQTPHGSGGRLLRARLLRARLQRDLLAGDLFKLGDQVSVRTFSWPRTALLRSRCLLDTLVPDAKRIYSSNGAEPDMEFWQAISFTETEQLIDIAKYLEQCGWTGVATGEHLVLPGRIDSDYPYAEDGKSIGVGGTAAPVPDESDYRWDPNAHFPDPWVMAGVLMTHTERLRFMTTIAILPLHDLFTVAKALSSAAYWAGDRITLGVGSGYLQEEFYLTGQNFEDRGPRMDEMLEALELIFAGGMVEYHGKYIDFPRVQMAPVPKSRIPIFASGHTAPAIRRAVRLDGWISAPMGIDEGLAYMDKIDFAREQAGTSQKPFDYQILLSVIPTLDEAKRLRDRGVTGVVIAPWYTRGTAYSTFEFKKESIARLADEVIFPLRES
jgi:alkanesulfonate monooxygenase SsuD/methylene tetrahydromethanopterin reductase-like flavin-dependent oxidoreductase (luciferase family)